MYENIYDIIIDMNNENISYEEAIELINELSNAKK